MSCKAAAANCVEPVWLNCPSGWVFVLFVALGILALFVVGGIISWTANHL